MNVLGTNLNATNIACMKNLIKSFFNAFIIFNTWLLDLVLANVLGFLIGQM